MSNKRYSYMQNIAIIDPNGNRVEMEIYFDHEINAPLGVDSSHASQLDEFWNPYTGEKQDYNWIEDKIIQS